MNKLLPRSWTLKSKSLSAASSLRVMLRGVVLGASFITILSAPAILAAESPSKSLNDVAVRLEPIVEGIPQIEPGEKGKASFLFTNTATRELLLTWKVQIDLPGNTPGVRRPRPCEKRRILGISGNSFCAANWRDQL